MNTQMTVEQTQGRKMGKCSKKDFISDLPEGIIDSILIKLPIRDAVRTSILSSKWRYQWTTVTQLAFDVRVCFREDGKIAQKEFVNFIKQFLSRHEGGPIHKFKLSTWFLLRQPTHKIIEQWLHSLSMKDIKELDLDVTYGSYGFRFRTPSCIFSCQQLTRLKLSGFELKPPLGFQGFPCLKYLKLFCGTVALKAVENFISGCPLLEKLKIRYTIIKQAAGPEFAYYKDADLDFWEKECPANISFKHLKIVKVTSDVPQENDMEFVKFVLGRSPVLEVMKILSNYINRNRYADRVLHFRRASSKVEIKFFDLVIWSSLG